MDKIEITDNKPNDFKQTEFDNISSGKTDKDSNFIEENQKGYVYNTVSDDISARYVSRKLKHNLFKNTIITFNNEEPLSFAIKKVVFEIVVVLFFIIGLILILSVVQFGFSKLGNDDIENLSSSSLYESTVNINGIEINNNYDDTLPNNIVISVSDFYNIDIEDEISLSPIPRVLKLQLSKNFSNLDVTLLTNTSNYSYLTQIYTHLQNNNIVIVCLSVNDSISYAIVTELDAAKSKITVALSDGSTETMSIDNFILATRYDNETKLSLKLKFLKMIGAYSVNTAFIISDEVN
ncbi:MAG: hypothetical protein R3Y35_00425 [Clostridia bacterium]